jgi:hypothetical protein
MLDPRGHKPVRFPADQRPMLIVVVDTEEEFDWSQPVSRTATGVTHIPAQARAQEIFGRFGVKPTYVVDYAVAAQEQGYKTLRAWSEAGRCDIGAHLHPWVNPPDDEPVNNRNSYPGNLPAALERAKLARLSELIGQRFGRRPTVYRAGRYGVGPHTTAILEELGFEIDTSVVPRTDFTPDEGPDFARCGIDPYWFGRSRRLLEIPLSVGWTGLLAGAGPVLQPVVRSDWARHLRIPGLLARGRLFDRVRLTPEGISLAELKRLTRAMLRAGHRVFNFTYHSPSLAPGHTPYVRSEDELRAFTRTIAAYLEFFFGEIGGIAATPHDVRAACERLTAPGASGAAAAAQPA